MAKLKKESRIEFVLTLEEKKIITEKAKEAGYKSVSMYLRIILLESTIMSKTDIQMLNNIHKIGVNLNQIARICNQYNDDNIIRQVKIDIDNTLNSLNEYIDFLVKE